MQEDNPAAAPWSRIKVFFEQALELPTEERAGWVEAAALDPAERDELLSLLQHHAAATQAPGFMAQAATDGLLGPADRAGQRLGPWRLLAPLGSGGMGDVFEAERADGRFESRVAIKLLRRGMDSAAVLQRFAQEQQSLARLQHPGIARLHDAGAADDGAPWFAMELVRGAAHRPGLRRPARGCPAGALPATGRRGGLCPPQPAGTPGSQAGQRAGHGRGQVKLLDFGIAKAMDPREPGAGGAQGDSDPTLGGTPPFTPRYASPEQVRGEPVSTSTDLYSLGVLLYVMLTGQRPMAATPPRPRPPPAACWRNTPPGPAASRPRPSRRGTGCPPAATCAATWTTSCSRRWRRTPDARYPSVDAMAADLRAMLAGFPVSARPQGAAYHFAKFVGRHRGIVLASSLAALALAGGLAATAWQAHAARLARDEARAARSVAEGRLAAMREVTHDLVFRYGDSVEFLPGGAEIKAALYRDTLQALQRLGPTAGGDLGALADIAVTHARLAELLAEGFAGSMGQAAQAREHAERAIALVPQVWPVARRDARAANWLARAHDVKAAQLREAGDLPQSLAVLQAGLGLLDEALAAATDDTGRLWLLGERSSLRTGVAMVYDNPGPNLGQPDRAATHFRQAADDIDELMKLDTALDALDASTRPENIRSRAHFQFSQGVTLGMLSATDIRRGNYGAALQAREKSVQALRNAVARDERQLTLRNALASAGQQLALLALLIGDRAKALAAATESHEVATRLVAAEPGNAGWRETMALGSQGLGSALLAGGRAQQALPVLDQGVAYWAAEVARDPRHSYQRVLALMRLRRGQAAAATGDTKVGQADARAATQALAALSSADPKAFDARLGWSEGAAWLAGQPRAEEAWGQQACTALAEAAALRPLPPVALQPGHMRRVRHRHRHRRCSGHADGPAGAAADAARGLRRPFVRRHHHGRRLPGHPDSAIGAADRVRRDRRRLGGAALRGCVLSRSDAGRAVHPLRDHRREAQAGDGPAAVGGTAHGAVACPLADHGRQLGPQCVVRTGERAQGSVQSRGPHRLPAAAARDRIAAGAALRSRAGTELPQRDSTAAGRVRRRGRAAGNGSRGHEQFLGIQWRARRAAQ